jgi:hypothetical protein
VVLHDLTWPRSGLPAEARVTIAAVVRVTVRHRLPAPRWRPEGTPRVCTVNVSASMCLVAGTLASLGWPSGVKCRG